MDNKFYANLIIQRLKELGARVKHIDEELGIPKPTDLEEQAIDIEDDEVLESLGAAAEKEVGLLRQALKRLEDGTYGICLGCGDPISEERLQAVLYAPLCKKCVHHT
ncbi:TraR/DksA family transcriptional regulator [Sulfitobacter sp. JB4-11]|uniref:TraR/DksA family transcriptional regulator n=1 Tax=Sulfitobacter rhodophyticola TaxID=3238304 RepID=UPI0035190646